VDAAEREQVLGFARVERSGRAIVGRDPHEPARATVSRDSSSDFAS
jgi:hypothetical protein